MRAWLDSSHWTNFRRGQETCFLLTNGLGGYSSMTVIGDTPRMDHALLMAAVKAPNARVKLLANVKEQLMVRGEAVSLFSQEFVNHTRNQEGFGFLESFSMEQFPVWQYRIGAAEVEKRLFMRQGSNTIVLQYTIRGGSGTRLFVFPLLCFAPKGRNPEFGQNYQVDSGCITSAGLQLFYASNGTVELIPEERLEDLYYEQDARDGRDAVGCAVINHRIRFEVESDEASFYLVYSTQPFQRAVTENRIRSWEQQEVLRRQEIMERSGIQSEVGRQLACSAAQYVVERESTGGKSIIAGYPYFGDWGRDTMIALPGCTLAIGDTENCRSILRTFMAYCRKGLMPNLFPENDGEPMYNTVDAALLFFESVYEYWKATDDLPFIRECYPVMEEIVNWYRKGTDYHIFMDRDGLISAGDELEQVTWMDVRIGEELPTPRHGKAVEINSYWYNALKILEEFSAFIGKNGTSYGMLAEQVKQSFLEQFWMEREGYLKDVVNGTPEERQFRCNQVFALSMSYQMLSKEQARRILRVVKERLYTTVGLRSLDPADPAFHPWYGGSQPERDRAYHQGTVWTFPLGAYYRAVLKNGADPISAAKEVRRGLEQMESWLFEGCLFHLAEIYDGGRPVASKGCYGQAWSVGEIMRLYRELEQELYLPENRV